MDIVDLDIPRTTKQQQKYQRMIILSIANVKILTKCTKHSVVTSPMTTEILCGAIQQVPPVKAQLPLQCRVLSLSPGNQAFSKITLQRCRSVTVTIEDNAGAGGIAEQEAAVINEVRELQNKWYVSGAETAWSNVRMRWQTGSLL